MAKYIFTYLLTTTYLLTYYLLKYRNLPNTPCEGLKFEIPRREKIEGGWKGDNESFDKN